jgi:hypothetical protein
VARSTAKGEGSVSLQAGKYAGAESIGATTMTEGKGGTGAVSPRTLVKISALIQRLQELREQFGDTVVWYEKFVWGSLALHENAIANEDHECELRPPATTTPSDTEQLLGLRTAAEKALKRAETLYEHFMEEHACGDFTCCCGDCGLCELRAESKQEIDALRHALGKGLLRLRKTDEGGR